MKSFAVIIGINRRVFYHNRGFILLAGFVFGLGAVIVECVWVLGRESLYWNEAAA